MTTSIAPDPQEAPDYVRTDTTLVIRFRAPAGSWRAAMREVKAAGLVTVEPDELDNEFETRTFAGRQVRYCVWSLQEQALANA